MKTWINSDEQHLHYDDAAWSQVVANADVRKQHITNTLREIGELATASAADSGRSTGGTFEDCMGLMVTETAAMIALDLVATARTIKHLARRVEVLASL